MMMVTTSSRFVASLLFYCTHTRALGSTLVLLKMYQHAGCLKLMVLIFTVGFALVFHRDLPCSEHMTPFSPCFACLEPQVKLDQNGNFWNHVGSSGDNLLTRSSQYKIHRPLSFAVSVKPLLPWTLARPLSPTWVNRLARDRCAYWRTKCTSSGSFRFRKTRRVAACFRDVWLLPGFLPQFFWRSRPSHRPH